MSVRQLTKDEKKIAREYQYGAAGAPGASSGGASA